MDSLWADRNALAEILVLRMGLLLEPELRAGLEGWQADGPGRVEQFLQERGLLTAGQAARLAAEVERQISRIQGQSGGPSARASGEPAALLWDRGIPPSLSEENTLRDLLGDTSEVRSGGDEGDETVDDPERATFPEIARFEVLRCHAQGGLGQVFVARDRELRREVALKQILPRHAGRADSRERFVVEGELTGQLEHPGIVPVYSLGTDASGNPFYAMRLIRGTTMKAAIEELYRGSGGRQHSGAELDRERRRLVRRLIDVCNAIHYAHSRGVLHRDIKPANIMLGRYGETLVVDWGLARVMSDPARDPEMSEPFCVPSSGDGSSKTRVGSIIGTPSYMSPEQAEGIPDRLGPWTDVYCLGSTLYCILTGQPPFQADGTGEIYGRIRAGQFEPPRKMRPEIPRAVEAVCLRAMRTNPNDRYPTPAALAEDLERWLAGEPVHAWREPLPDRLMRWVRRHRALAAGTAILLMATTAALLVINGLVTRQNRSLTIARDDARQNFIRAEAEAQRAEGQRRIADAERQRAEANQQTARETTLKVVDIAESALSNLPGKETERREVTREAVAMYEQLLARSPDDPEVRFEAASVFRKGANLHRFYREFAEAGPLYEASLALWRGLAVQQPDDPKVIDALAGTLLDKAGWLHMQQKVDDGFALVEEAEQLLSSREGGGELTAAQRSSLARILNDKGTILFQRGDTAAALVLLQRTAEIYDGLIPEPVGDTGDAVDGVFRVLSRVRLAEALLDAGRHDEALETARENVTWGRRRIESLPQPDQNIRMAVGRAVNAFVSIALRGGHRDSDLIGQQEWARDLLRQLVAERGDSIPYRDMFARASRQMGELLEPTDPAAARECYSAAREQYESVVSENSSGDLLQGMARTLAGLARLDRAADPAADVAPLLDRAAEFCARARARSGSSVTAQRRIEEVQAMIDALRADSPQGGR